METVSASDTDAASSSRLTRQNTCSHSTWPPLSGSGSQSFDQASETGDPSAGITAVVSAISQRRRVNPETLALRLGPDLVRDLEALIQPGNIEMPAFALRKELQERYNTDRRHIYDYFHSRGLRVIKEDKNGNAIVPKDLTPAPSPKPNLRVRISRQASAKESRRASAANLASNLMETRPPVSKPRGVIKAKPDRRKKYTVRSTQDPAIVCLSSRTAHPISPLFQPESFSVTSKNYEPDPVVNPPDEFHSFAQAMNDISDMHCGTPVFENSPALHNLSRTALDLRTDGTGLGLSPSADPFSPIFCTAPEQPVLYQVLSGAFGTRDTQECTGTYRTYMQERSRLYYEGLLAVPYPRSCNDRKPTSSGDHQSVPYNNSEFRRWILNPGEFCVADEKASVSRNKPVKVGANTIRLKASPVLSYASFGTDHEAHPLDTLFPMLDQNKNSIDELRESPVVRTRRQSYVPLDFYSFPNVESGEAEDLRILLAAPSSGAPGLPELSHSVSLPSKIREESLHGRPDFPGSPPLLPSAELQHVDVNPKRLTPRLQQPGSSLNVHERGTFTPKEKSNRENPTQTRFAPCTPPKSQLCDYDRIRMRSLTSCSARRRTTSAGGGI